MEKSNDQYPKNITPDVVRKYTQPTEKFLCPLSANHYNIQFLSFKIRDYETKKVFFEISREPSDNIEENKLEEYDINEADYRTVRYQFGPNFFKIQKIATSLIFSIGNKPAKNFLMIERHYFKNQLIQSYEFNFPFCMPSTSNEWESIYDMPIIDTKLQQQMIENPFDTKSDSFYFVSNELIMHNKAEYDYSPQDEYEQSQ